MLLPPLHNYLRWRWYLLAAVACVFAALCPLLSSFSGIFCAAMLAVVEYYLVTRYQQPGASQTSCPCDQRWAGQIGLNPLAEPPHGSPWKTRPKEKGKYRKSSKETRGSYSFSGGTNAGLIRIWSEFVHFCLRILECCIVLKFSEGLIKVLRSY